MAENQETSDPEIYKWELFEIGVESEDKTPTPEDLDIEAPPPVEELL